MAENTNDKTSAAAGYDFAAHERPLFEAWKDAGYFQRTPGFGACANAPYTVVIPPPNITGMLHMGHALNDTIQDACIRRARMQGHPTRWVLGTDHAGIATQTKVDKALAEKGISRLEIGREAFVEACYDWYREYGATIVRQIEGMGCSCDYADEHFTMEPAYVRAVRQVFSDWYHAGLVYKGKRIVNWCPHCTTAIADDEAEYVDEAGHLWYLRYPLVDPAEGDPDYLVVATTRPETMLGDTGVAVNPKDARFAHLVGKRVRLPLVDREIPVFADYHVDAEFGTGCVKVTPSHDANDWAMGERAGLPRVNVFDETAHVVEGYGKFSGMDRDEAREAVVAAFDELGLLDHVEDHAHSVMTCYRCHTKLEPWESEQWFVAVDALKKDAARVVEDGSIQFSPRPVGAGVSGLAGQPQGLVHLAPAVVGPPHPHVLLRRVRLAGRQRGGRGNVPRVRSARAPGRGRAGHVVQLAAVAVRDARLGGGGHGRARDARVLSHAGAVHRARHHGAVGGAHGHVVHVLHRAGALRARDHPPHGHGGRRQAHEQEPRQRR